MLMTSSRMTFVAAIAACSLACSPKNGDDVDPGTTDGTIDGSVAEDGGEDTGGFSLDAPPDVDLGNRCLADLQTIVDPSGKIVAKCPPDQGCLNGACVKACDAAAGSKSTIGCDYYAHQYAISISNSDTWWLSGDVRGGCYAAVVVNTWSTPAHLSVTRAGTSFPIAPFARVLGTDSLGNLTYEPYPSTGLPSNAAAVLFLSYDKRGAGKGLDVPCPPGVTAATSIDSAIHVTGYNDAFEIASDRPVNAYQVYPWGGAPSVFPSATLLYPSTAWGTNYVAPAINDAYAVKIGAEWEKPFVTLVASDDTTVTLLPKVDIVGNATTGVPASPKSVPVSYPIKKGQYLQLLQMPNLGGTVVSSTKPVGMFIGSMLFRLPVSGGGDADNQGQMVPPIRAQGSEYIGASYELPQPTSFQVVGAVKGTTLTYDPGPPPGAPSTINTGDVLEFETQTEFTVRSQDTAHPFYMAVYKRSDDSGSNNGPDFVNLLPPVQFRSHYVFVTDPTYKVTTLVFVRAKGAGDITLDCAGVVKGWKPIGSGAYQVARVVFGTGNTCKDGAHAASGPDRFGITVWGWAFAASYGYPAGGNAAPVNDVVVPTTIK